jgi:aminopeptidase N
MAAAPGDPDLGAETNIFRFEMPQPVPAYLFAIAVGNLTCQDLSPRCRLYAEPESIDAAAWEFAETETSIKIAEELFGPYAWERYDLLLMPPSFPYGGMENPRLNFLTPTLLAGDRSLTSVVVHELAHSWTGNLVTNATWADFWLNEGWTVYGERRILERQYGPEIAKLASGLGYRQLKRGMEYFGEDSDGTRLVSKEKSDNPDRLNYLVPYEKGFAFLTCIERTVGREVFDPFILKYMDTFRFKSITTDDFLAFLVQEIPEIENTLNFEEWIYGTGMPEDTPQFESELLGQVMAAMASFEAGVLPAVDQVEHWHPSQIDLFLRLLPGKLSADQVYEIDQLFSLHDSQNYENLASFYPLAIQSGYKRIMPRVAQLLDTIGRVKLIGPIYIALARTEWSRDQARPLFEKYRSGYHPIAERGINKILSDPGV